MKDDKLYRIGTRAVHGGVEPDQLTGAVMTPIYQTATYAQSEPGVTKGYDYSRTNNPTREALEHALASLENADYGIAFSSGMGAVTAVMQMLQSSDHVICSDDVYGGTFRLFDKIFKHFMLEFSFVDTTDVKNIELSLTPMTKLFWIETPTNPTLKITDIVKAVELAKKVGALVVVDNTFMSPYFQSPLFQGADLVLYSTTKYISGHSDVIGGAIVTNNANLAEKLHFIQNASGAIPGPMDCFLTLRGIKTIHLRMARHEENAQKIYEYLMTQPSVKKLYYPGNPNHHNHSIQCRQACGYGAIISIELGDLQSAKKFISGLKIFTLAESLGGVESLIDHPAIMTHASLTPEARQALGITDGFIRLSIGIEDAEAPELRK